MSDLVRGVRGKSSILGLEKSGLSVEELIRIFRSSLYLSCSHEKKVRTFDGSGLSVFSVCPHTLTRLIDARIDGFCHF